MDRHLVGDAPGLRERRRIRQKLAVQDEALKLFATKGYEQTTVEDIAHAAAISPRTFFRYFATKEDVVLWDEYDDQPFIDRGAAPVADPLTAMISAVQAQVADLYEKDRDKLLTRVRLSFREPTLRARFLAAQFEVVAASYGEMVTALGGDPDDLQLRIRVGALYVAIFVAVERWQRGDGREHIGELIATAIATLAADWPDLANVARSAASAPRPERSPDDLSG